jgi:hypothetical protein
MYKKVHKSQYTNHRGVYDKIPFLSFPVFPPPPTPHPPIPHPPQEAKRLGGRRRGGEVYKKGILSYTHHRTKFFSQIK